MKNNEQIIDVPLDIIDNLPFAMAWKAGLTKINAGNLQRNYNFRNEGVLHISPISMQLTKDEAHICRRWVMSDKNLVLLNNQPAVERSSSATKVNFPRIRVVGDVIHECGIFSFWYEDYIGGKLLNSAIHEGFGFSGYSSIIEWVSEFHGSTQKVESVRDYYAKRLQSFRNIFNGNESLLATISESDLFLIKDLIKRRFEEIDTAVDYEERTCLVHGDLRGDNILIDDDGGIGVIDFEQGVLGGDWFCDLAKLLDYFNNKLPDSSRPYLYRPPLTSEEKARLTRQYIKQRLNKGWTAPNFISLYVESTDIKFLKSRYDLYNFDMIMSVMVLRNAMGWNFYTRDICSQQERGVLYLLEKLKEDYG